MNGEAAVPIYTPTVLIVEDDKTCGRYLRRKFHDHTSVGVVLAADIEAGYRLACEIKFDALVFDLFFDHGADWPANELYDGVDLAAEIQAQQPELPTYFLSFFSEDSVLHEKANSKNVAAAGWLQKSFVSNDRVQPEDAPWCIVERDLFRQQLSESVADVQGEDAQGEDALTLALQLRRPIRTFIQELPTEELTVTHPIEVICTLDDGLAKASAPALGMLQDGYGESVQEAIDDLQATLAEQFDWLTAEKVETVDYAAAVREQLMKKIRRGQK